MPERLSKDLRAFSGLARVVAAGAYEGAGVLDRICAEIRAAFDLERALIARLRADEGTVHAVVQHGVDWPGDEWLPLEHFPMLEQALATRTAVLVHDPLGENALPASIVTRFGVGEVVAVPLTIDERCLGFLVADRGGRPLDLSEDDLLLLTAVGWVAAVFVDKADQYDELRRLDEAKTEFVSLASHELRTPIAVVHGIAATLHLRGRELGTGQLDELRTTLFEQTTRLVELTDQLLDLSRIDAGAVAVKIEAVRPRERVDELLPRIAPDRLGDIAVEVDPGLVVETDPDGLERILSNLIVNALRYGRPPICVRSTVGSAVRISVEDAGLGVDPGFVPQLFGRFTRSDSSRRTSAGAGLGLSIARSFAEAIGATLSYARGEAGGACFTLELPIA